MARKMDGWQGERRRLRSDLREAVASGAFGLAATPRRCLADWSLAGDDVSLRWMHRGRGTSAGPALWSLLEEMGFSRAVAPGAIDRACQEAARRDGVTLTLALPALLLDQDALPDWVGCAVERAGLPPDRLALEFPETGLAQAGEAAIFALAALRDRGIGIVAGSFGSEQACLRLLDRLPLSWVKLDRALVRAAPDDADARLIADCVVRFAHGVGLRVVAAGLDTEAQLAAAQACGCDEAEGTLTAVMPALAA